MRQTQYFADALVAWAVETCPEILGTYNHPHAEKKFSFPDVAAEVQETTIARGDQENFPIFDFQQVLLRMHRFSLMFVVDPDDPENATKQLETIVDALQESHISDATLGARVHAVSPLSRAQYEPPFIQFDDGTRGRLATLEVLVADIIDEEE